MSVSFRDLLNSMYDENILESSEDPMDVALNTDEVMNDLDDMEDDDLEGLSDDDLDKLANDLSSDIDMDDIDAIDNEEDDIPPLTPSQDAEADDMMNIAATSQLIQNSLTDEQCKKMTESAVDLQILVDEGLMTESDMYSIIESSLVTEKSWYANRQRIELGKEARIKQLYSIAIFAEARARNDPEYRKLQKVYKMRNILRSRLEKKYQGPAKKRVRSYIQRLKQSNNSAVAKIGKDIDK